MRRFLIGAVAMAIAAPAVAAPRHESVTVRTGDLALTRPVDAQRLLRRLDKAALGVCGASISSLREQQRAARGSDCYARAMGEAVSAVGAPAVSERYRAKGRS